MLLKTIENYYYAFINELENTNNKKLKHVINRLNELDDISKKMLLRKATAEATSSILLGEIHPDDLEDFLIESIDECIELLKDTQKKYVFRVKVKGLEKHLTREIAIPKSFLLSDLGIAIVLAFNGDCEHLMEFHIDKERYVMNPEDSFYSYQKSMFDYELMNLELNPKSKIRFIYDFGEDYIFDIKFVKEVEGLGHYPIEVLKGKGFGIVEDNHMFLDLYYEDPNLSMLEYIGEDITISEFLEVEEFNLEEANEYLNNLFIVVKTALEGEE